MPVFFSVTQFRISTESDSMEVRNLFYRWKMFIDNFWQWKNTKNKVELRKY